MRLKRSVVAILGVVLLLLSQHTVRAQQDQALRARAEAAVRDNRAGEAITLLDATVRAGSADWTTRLVYVVALIADSRIDAAEREISGMEKIVGSNPAQLGVLRASITRVKAAKEASSKIGPLLERGEVRTALKTLEAAPGQDAGNVIARAYLLRVLGEFNDAERLLTEAQAKAPAGDTARFSRAVADSKSQRAAFEVALERFDTLVASDLYSKAPNGCGGATGPDGFGACRRQAITNASQAAESLFAIAPFSVPALAGRLVQAIWTGKDDDAIDLVRKTRSNQKLLVIPSEIKPEIGEHAKGYLAFRFDSNEIEWLDGGEAIWATEPLPGAAERRQGARYMSNKKAKIPPSHTKIPFSQVKDFGQELDNSNSNFLLYKSVAFKPGIGPLGGVAQSEIFAEVFKEIPFRLAMRTYGKVVAECLGLTAGKYKLVGETPSHRGAMFSGIMNAATAGMAQANGDVATSNLAAGQASESFIRRGEAIAREQQAKLTWQQQMSDVRLALDATTIRAEIVALLDETVAPPRSR